MAIEAVTVACKKFTSKQNFEAILGEIFVTVFENDEQVSAMFVAGVYAEYMKEGLIVVTKEFSKRVVSVTHGLDQNFLGKFCKSTSVG